MEPAKPRTNGAWDEIEGLVAHSSSSAAAANGPAEPSRPMAQPALRAACALAAIVLLHALFVLLGWFLREPAFTAINPAMVSMKANAALAMALLALAVILAARCVGRSRAAQWTFGAAIGIGLLSLVQEIFGLQLGIDQIVSEDFARPALTMHRGRMAPLSALAVVFLGTAGLWLRSGRALSRVGQLATGFGALLAAHTLFGYAYNVEALYRLPGTTATSLQGALSLGVLATALIFADPHRGFGKLALDPRPSGILTRRMVPILFGFPMLLAWIALSLNLSGAMFATAVTSGVSLATAGVLAWSILALRRSEDALTRSGARLLASERVFRSSFENVFVGMAHVDRAGRWTHVNGALQRILGKDSNDLLGHDVGEGIHSEDRALLERELQRVQKGLPSSSNLELRWRSGAGDWRVLSTQVSRIDDDAGQHQHFVFVLDDITLDREYEERLLVQARSLEAAGVGLVICDARRGGQPIVFVNTTYERITGYTAAEMLGQSCRILNRLARDQQELDEVRAAIAQGRDCAVTLLNHRKDGTPIWIELTLTPVRDRRGQVTHFIGVQNDVTKKRELAVECDRLLQDAVSARTHAEQATRARDSLLTIVSHELRSPLNSIRLWATLLRTSGADDPRLLEQAVGHIDTNVDLQSRLVDDLLDVSRLSAGRLELRRAEVDLVELVKEVVEEALPRAKASNVSISADIPAGELYVDGDITRLQQVVRNLIENAIKFTPEGGEVSVRLGQSQDEAKLEVTDSGCGIEPSKLDRVFDQFWQGDDPGQRRFRGLGLGLHIVRHLVERHSGKVDVVSAGVGKGATFTVCLPLLDSPREKSRREQRPSPEAAEVGADVLVVDDERATAEALALSLIVRGIPVRTALDVESARRAIEERRPSVIVSDLMMPNISGIEFIRGLRQEEVRGGFPRARAIAISGRGNPSDRRSLRVAGFDAFMAKPIRIDALSRWIREESAEAPIGFLWRRILIHGEVEGVTAQLEDLDLEVRAVPDLEAVRVAMREWQPDVVVLDADRAGVDEAVRRLRMDFADPVICALVTDPDALRESAGFDFILHKPLDTAVLVRTLGIHT